MTVARIQAILHTVDADPKNYVTNSWCVQGDNVGTQSVDIITALRQFYVDVTGYLSPSIAQNGHEFKISALPGTPPNYPYYETPWNLAAAPAGTMLPSEVAVCLSFQADRTAGLPQARRRGRVYIGPLDSTANDTGRPAAAMATAMANAALTLHNAWSTLSTPVYWSVWSPTDADASIVANGWIDNAFDTQRRRGIERTSRTTWAV